MTDGTAAGTSELAVAGAASFGLNPFGLTVLGGKLLFEGTDANGDGLWVTDGTAGGTSELSVTGAAASGLNPSDMTALGSEAVFAGKDVGGNAGLWVTDGTASGTSELSVAGAFASGLHPDHFAVFGNTVLFSGTDAGGNAGVWQTDGTSAGTTELQVTGSLPFGLFPADLTALGNEALFQAAAPCFARGTRIATERGDVAVEQLRVGDRALTAGRSARPIGWIGQRRVNCARHPRPELVWPVRIRAGAFGDGEPRRDLRLSPDHAVFVGGALVPIKHLVNGATVVQEPLDAVHYFHVELDRHDILLAEGLAAESYLDTGNRAQFANGGDYIALHPDFSPLNWDDACAPLTADGDAVLSVRRRLLARVAALGYVRCAEPQFAVLADDDVISPAKVTRKLYRYVLPAGARELRLVSGVAVPAGHDLANSDCRTLGARIGAIFFDQDLVPLDSPLLAEGFHPIERNGAELWRWTDGAARLILPSRPRQAVTLELLVRDVMRGWVHMQGSQTGLSGCAGPTRRTNRSCQALAIPSGTASLA